MIERVPGSIRFLAIKALKSNLLEPDSLYLSHLRCPIITIGFWGPEDPGVARHVNGQNLTVNEHERSECGWERLGSHIQKLAS